MSSNWINEIDSHFFSFFSRELGIIMSHYSMWKKTRSPMRIPNSFPPSSHLKDFTSFFKTEIKYIITMSNNWIVIEETYPTTYGCHAGQRGLTDAEVFSQSNFEVYGPYASESEAVRNAITVRDESCNFEDWESVDEKLFEDGPPYCSALLENYDNDEEVLIKVSTVEEHDAYMRRMIEMVNIEIENNNRKFQESLKKRLKKLSQQVMYTTLFLHSHMT